MAATIVSTTPSSTNVGTALTVAMPAAPTVGNLLVMLLGFWTTAPTTGLSAWTLQELVSDTSSMRIAVYTRVCDGSEASSYNVSGYVSGDSRTALVLQISGQNGYDVDASQHLGGPPFAAQSVTTTADNDLVITAVYSQAQTSGNSYTWSGGTGVGSLIQSAIADGWYSYFSAVSDVKTPPGATTARTATPVGTNWSTNYATATISIKAGVASGISQGSFFPFFNIAEPYTSPATSNATGSGSLTVTANRTGTPALKGSGSLTVTASRSGTAAVGGGGSIANRPANPAIICYDSTAGTASAWAHPGALVVAGRTNYNDTAFHTIAAGGGTVLIYLDTILNNTTGLYHQLLVNSSAYGGAVPLWPGPLTGNSFGQINDFRIGGVLQSKLAGVLNRILDDNPHCAGWFLDDVGSRSYYPGFSWEGLTSTAKEQWRSGAIGIVQTARTVADARDAFVMVNGTWGAQSTTGIGDGGYPTRSSHGMSLADGGFIENHATSEAPYWTGYAGPGSQWGQATPRGLNYCWFSNVGNTTARDYWVSHDLTAFASTNGYSDGLVTPWRSFTNFGLPNRD